MVIEFDKVYINNNWYGLNQIESAILKRYPDIRENNLYKVYKNYILDTTMSCNKAEQREQIRYYLATAIKDDSIAKETNNLTQRERAASMFISALDLYDLYKR